jgi:hypothetical protein
MVKYNLSEIAKRLVRESKTAEGKKNLHSQASWFTKNLPSSSQNDIKH